MSELLHTGTVTLVLGDVEGSTRLWETQPEKMAAVRARFNREVSEAIATHQGVRPVEQGEGDSFVAGFARASDALACALTLQQAPLAPIRLRIGVHTGEARSRDDANYAGPAINRTARLRDLAHGGQTVISGATEELVADQLPDGVWWPIWAATGCVTCPAPNGCCSRRASNSSNKPACTCEEGHRRCRHGGRRMLIGF